MEPLSEAQLLELDEIAKLPQEEQSVRVKEFFSTLTPEQIEWLKSQQQTTVQCPFCLISGGKIRARIVYTDEDIIAALDINPANPGHVIVFPKEHIKTTFDLEKNLLLHLYDVSNELAKFVQSAVNATGVNILISNGYSAGQKVEHIVLHIIPRFENDKIKFVWENKKLDDNEMDNIAQKFQQFIYQVQTKEEPIEVEEVKEVFPAQDFYYVSENERIP
ncbi:HIT family protein [Candidatus Woesearchaeota archaeon]|nr:HIT family protein [Candidatus Woesearchaeota archaeon]